VPETIKPTRPAGTRDFLPQQMLARQAMIDKIAAVYQAFGFSPLKTPAIERELVLTGGKSLDTVIWRAMTSAAGIDDEALALHFDLTVPLARVVAANPDLPRPFRRYQCQDVWRGEDPQHGRYREFMQFDADIVGSASLTADAEIIWLMVTAMKAVGFERFQVRWSSRKVLNALADMLGLEPHSDQAKDFFRILDKQDKIGRDGVFELLTKKFVPKDDRDPNDPDATESGLEFGKRELDTVARFLDIDPNPGHIFAELSAFFIGHDDGMDAVGELASISDILSDLAVPREHWVIDLSVARGLDYYTGPVFETTLLDYPEIGSVFSGGRFDDLVARFTGESMPAVGASIGVDRMFAAMEHLGMVDAPKTVTRVLVTVMDPELEHEYLKIVSELRAAGIPTELYMGPDMAFRAQLAYALNLEIPFMIIMGGNEMADGTVQLKDTRNREQYPVERDALIAALEKRGFLHRLQDHHPTK